jgi:hypothetical protein
MDKSPLHVVLDMDGTLIDNGYINTKCPDMVCNYGYGYFRPGLKEFLTKCFDTFASVSIWTAASDDWLQLFFKSIGKDLSNKFLFKWSFSRCSTKDYGDGFGPLYIKKLRKMWKTDMANNCNMTKDNTIIVDDTKEICQENYGNAIYIKSWILTDYDDVELKRLYKYLCTLKPSVRDIHKLFWEKKIEL